MHILGIHLGFGGILALSRNTRKVYLPPCACMVNCVVYPGTLIGLDRGLTNGLASILGCVRVDQSEN